MANGDVVILPGVQPKSSGESPEEFAERQRELESISPTISNTVYIISSGGRTRRGSPSGSGARVRAEQEAQRRAEEEVIRREAERKASEEASVRVAEQRAIQERQNIISSIQKREVQQAQRRLENAERQREINQLRQREREERNRIGREILFGQTGKRFVGFGQKSFGITTGRPRVTAEEVKTKLRQGNTASKVTAEFIPTTPGEVAIVGGTAGAFPFIPPIGQIAVGGAVAGVEGKKALTPGLPKQQRIASGIIAGTAGAGVVIGVTPFVKGTTARFSPKFQPVKTQSEGFQAIVGKNQRIGLILEKSPAKTGETSNINLPPASPLVRGGFGVRQSEKKLFLGGPQTVTTSQVDFFKPGKSIVLEREFFTTPQEPFINIPETRVSRLGLADLTKSPKQVEIGFGLPGQPQIGLETRAVVTRSGKGSSFKIGTGTELEAIKGPRNVLSGVEKIGVTTIRGQRVDIYQFRTARGDAPVGIKSIFPTESTRTTTRISGEATLGTAGATTSLFPKVPTTTKAPPTSTSPFMRSGGGSRRGPTSTRIPSGGLTTPTTTTPPPIQTSPQISLPKITTVPTTTITLPKSPAKIPIALPKQRAIVFSPRRQRGQTGNFQVFGRRFGKFKLIGIGKTQGQALTIGKRFTTQTLGATFKIPKFKGTKVPGFRTKTTREGTLFIEPKRRRLKRGSGEIPEIQLFRNERRRRKRR